MLHELEKPDHPTGPISKLFVGMRKALEAYQVVIFVVVGWRNVEVVQKFIDVLGMGQCWIPVEV